MAGLLGDGWDSPQSQAIMALAGGLLSENGSQGLGKGLLGASQAMQEAKSRALKEQYARAQMEMQQLELAKAKREASTQDGLNGLMSQFLQPGRPAQGGTGSVNAALPPELQIGALPPISARRPGFDVQGYTGEAMNRGYMNPLQALEMQRKFAPESQVNKLDVKDFDPASVAEFQRTGDYSVLKRMDKLHFGDTGGAITGLDPFTGKPVGAVPKTGNPFSDLLVSDGQGGVRANSPLVAAKQAIAKAGATTAITNVNAFEPFANKVQGDMGTALVKNFDTLQSVPQTLRALDEAKGYLAKSGSFVGSGAETKLELAKFFNNNFGTNIDPAGVKNAEALQSTLFYNVMDNLKKMDASPSQQQQKVMQDAFGRLTTDPAALPMIIDFYKGQVTSKAAEHNRRVKEAQSGPAGLKFPYDISIPLETPAPKSPRQPTSGAPTLRWNPTSGTLEMVNN